MTPEQTGDGKQTTGNPHKVGNMKGKPGLGPGQVGRIAGFVVVFPEGFAAGTSGPFVAVGQLAASCQRFAPGPAVELELEVVWRAARGIVAGPWSEGRWAS